MEQTEFPKQSNPLVFTQRELDVLACIASGRTISKEISQILGTSPKTVETHISHILTKIGGNTRRHILSFIQETGLEEQLRDAYQRQFCAHDKEAPQETFLSHTPEGIKKRTSPWPVFNHWSGRIGTLVVPPVVPLIILLVVPLGIIGVLSGGGLSYLTPTHTPLPTQVVLANGSHAAFLPRLDLLRQLDEAFSVPKDKPLSIRIVGLVGTGGIGKTTLARSYAHAHPASLVWEINAERLETLLASFKDLSYDLAKSPEQKAVLSEINALQETSARTKRLIQFTHDLVQKQPSWILIFDNVDDISLCRPFLPTQVLEGGSRNGSGQGKVILTTRDQNIKQSPLLSSVLDVGELSKDEAFTLFTTLLWGKEAKDRHEREKARMEKNGVKKEEIKKTIEGLLECSSNPPAGAHPNHPTRSLQAPLPDQDPNDIQAFLDHIPRFPLDISLAANYIRDAHLSFDHYLERLLSHHPSFHQHEKSIWQEVSEYTETRYGIVTLSVERLLDHNPHYRDLLWILAFVDSQNIPLQLLRESQTLTPVTVTPNTLIDTPVSMPINTSGGTNTTPPRVTDDSAKSTIAEPGTVGQFRTPLVELGASGNTSGKTPVSIQPNTPANISINTSAPTPASAPSNTSVGSSPIAIPITTPTNIQPNIQPNTPIALPLNVQGNTLVDSFIHDLQKFSLITVDPNNHTISLHRITQTILRHHLKHTIEIKAGKGEDEKEYDEKHYKEDHKTHETKTITNTPPNAVPNGRPNADILNITEVDRSSSAASSSTVQGPKRPLADLSIAGYTKTKTKTDPEIKTNTAPNTVPTAKYQTDTQPNTQTATKDDYQIHQEATAKVLVRYAKQATEQENYPVIHQLTHHLEQFTKNAECQDEVMAMLGILSYYTAHYDQARTLLESCINHERSKKTINHEILVTLLFHLGQTHKELMNVQESKDAFDQGISLCQQYFASDPRKSMHLTTSLANIYRRFDEFKTTEDLCSKNLTLYAHYAPTDYSGIAETLNTLCVTNREQGHYQKALECINQSLEIYKKHLPGSPVEYAHALGLLGHVNSDQGRYESARSLYEESLAIHLKHLPLENPKVLWLFVKLGTIYRRLGDVQKSLSYLDRVKSESSALSSPITPMVLALANHERAHIALQQNNIKEAAAFAEKTHAIFLEHYGPTHIKTLRALNLIGYVSLFEGGDGFEKAEECLQKALETFSNHQSPLKCQALDYLSELYRRKTQKASSQEEADVFRQQALAYAQQAIDVAEQYFPAGSVHRSHLQKQKDRCLKTVSEKARSGPALLGTGLSSPSDTNLVDMNKRYQ